MAQLLCIIGISKHINVASIGDTSFDIMKEEINCNCNFDAFCKPNCLAFLVFNLMFHVVHTS
jgi:hypothetical protein